MGFEDNRIQYLHDAEGNTTAVLVPIELWSELSPPIPKWHKGMLYNALAESKPETAIPLDVFLKEWESE